MVAAVSHIMTGPRDNRARTVLLTAKLGLDVAVLAASEVVDGAFVVRGFGGDPSQAFWWEIKGVRSDLDTLDVDRPKTEALVGAL